MLANILHSVLALARVLLASGLFPQIDRDSSDLLIKIMLNESNRILEFYHSKDKITHELFFKENVGEEIGRMRSCH